MALPLPRVVADVGPGGPAVTAGLGINALTASNLNNIMKQLQNQYYGPNIESEIAQRQAATKGQDIFNQYAGEQYRLANELNAQKLEQLKLTNPVAYQQLLLQNAKAQIQNQLLNQILSGNQPFNQTSGGIASPGGQAPTPNQPLSATTNPLSNASNMQGTNIGPYTPIPGNIFNQPPPGPIQVTQQQNKLQPETPYGGTQPSTPSQPQQPMMQQPTPQQQGQGPTYAQAALASQLMGFGQPKIVDIDGTQTALTPWGPIPVAQGMTPYQVAQQKGMGDYSAKSYAESVESAKALEKQDVALDTIINAVNTNPQFRNVTGPIGSRLTDWAGSSGNKDLLGTLRTASGEIALQVAPSLKGAFTGRDQQLINQIKANPDTDFPDVFIGKLKAQKLIGTVLKEREYLAAKYKFEGMSPLEAEKRAAKETPLSKYKPIVDKLIHAPSSVPKGYVEMVDPKGGHHYIPKDKQELAKSPKYNFKAI